MSTRGDDGGAVRVLRPQRWIVVLSATLGFSVAVIAALIYLGGPRDVAAVASAIALALMAIAFERRNDRIEVGGDRVLTVLRGRKQLFDFEEVEHVETAIDTGGSDFPSFTWQVLDLSLRSGRAVRISGTVAELKPLVGVLADTLLRRASAQLRSGEVRTVADPQRFPWKAAFRGQGTTLLCMVVCTVSTLQTDRRYALVQMVMFAAALMWGFARFVATWRTSLAARGVAVSAEGIRALTAVESQAPVPGTYPASAMETSAWIPWSSVTGCSKDRYGVTIRVAGREPIVVTNAATDLFVLSRLIERKVAEARASVLDAAARVRIDAEDEDLEAEEIDDAAPGRRTGSR